MKKDLPLIFDSHTMLHLADLIIAAEDAGQPDYLHMMAEQTCFLPLREYPELAAKLRLLLTAEQNVQYLAGKLSDIGPVARVTFRRKRVADLIFRLDAARDERDRLWDDYEMYRCLVAYDNLSLKVPRS
jgi:hypothetical protein